MSAYRPRPAQFAGCLIGQCLGDALGFPVEGQPPAVCARYIAEALHPEDPRHAAELPSRSVSTRTTVNSPAS